MVGKIRTSCQGHSFSRISRSTGLTTRVRSAPRTSRSSCCLSLAAAQRSEGSCLSSASRCPPQEMKVHGVEDDLGLGGQSPDGRHVPGGDLAREMITRPYS